MMFVDDADHTDWPVINLYLGERIEGAIPHRFRCFYCGKHIGGIRNRIVYAIDAEGNIDARERGSTAYCERCHQSYSIFYLG